MADEYKNENERDREEFERLQNDQNSKFVVSPEGIFAISLIKVFGIDIKDERIQEAWEFLENYARGMYGMREFIAGIVFDRKGTDFISFSNYPNEEDE